MAVKSDNLKGNQWHDEGNGQFTSADSQGTKKDEQKKQGTSAPEIGTKVQSEALILKPGLDINAMKAKIASMSKPFIDKDLIMPKNLREAEEQGDRIIDCSGVVAYDDTTDVRVAFEFNKALQSVARDFPEIFKNHKLMGYGTSVNRVFNIYDDDSRMESIISQIVQEPLVKNRLNRLGLNNPSDYDEFLNLTKKGIMVNSDLVKNHSLSIHTGGEHMAIANMGYDFGISGRNIISQNRVKGVLNIGAYIRFNKDLAKSFEKYNAYPRSAIALGTFKDIGDKSGAFGAATHELGHICFNLTMSLAEPSDLMELYNIASENRQVNLGFYNYLPLENDLTLTGGIRQPGAVQRDINRIEPNAVSGYSCVNLHEHIAEAFQDYYCNGRNASRHNTRIVEFIKRLYHRLYGSK